MILIFYSSRVAVWNVIFIFGSIMWVILIFESLICTFIYCTLNIKTLEIILYYQLMNNVIKI